jgi:hypothetical protein
MQDIPSGDIELYSDSTYKANFYELGYSDGFWTRENNTLSLSSKYKECCIDSIIVFTSENNSKDSLKIALRYFDNSIPDYVCVILNSKDTVAFANDSVLSIPKKNYHFIQVLHHVVQKTNALSRTYSIPLTDSITVFYDYTKAANSYRYFYRKKYRIDNKSKTLKR